MELIAAIDIGTTATKAALIDRDGVVHASATAEYPTASDGRGRVEQEPEDWWRATRAGLARLLSDAPATIAALSLSGQMQDVILLDERDVLRPALLYSDTRARAEIAEILDRVGEERLLAVTGNLQDASSLLAKLLWLARHEPESVRRSVTVLLGAHDYVAWRLCGARVTDYTTASTTGLLDLGRNRWATGLVETLGLRVDWLPALLPADSVAGRLTDKAAAQTGLPPGLPVFHGAGDAATTTLGIGSGGAGRQYLYLGTSGWLARSSPGRAPETPAGIFTLRHPRPDWYLLIGPMLTAGGNLEWLREQFGALEMADEGMSAYDVLTELAATAQPGSGGLFYLPFLAGERAPFRDPNARGAFIGLTRTTSRAALYRSVLEGVAFAFRSIQEAMGPLGEPEAPLPVAGGGGRSALWCQILADVLARPVVVPAAPQDVAVRGAALLAGRGLGWYNSFAPGEHFFPVVARFQPRPEVVAHYDRAYELFKQLYPALQPLFAAGVGRESQ